MDPARSTARVIMDFIRKATAGDLNGGGGVNKGVRQWAASAGGRSGRSQQLTGPVGAGLQVACITTYRLIAKQTFAQIDVRALTLRA
jgi:hypothetical protein